MPRRQPGVVQAASRTHDEQDPEPELLRQIAQVPSGCSGTRHPPAPSTIGLGQALVSGTSGTSGRSNGRTGGREVRRDGQLRSNTDWTA
jgi:hypothetical protein